MRHGETKESKRGILLGHLPGTLSKKGRNDISVTAQTIKKLGLKPEIILSSDIGRARESSEILSKILGLKIKYNKLLRERMGGIAEGKKEKEIDWEIYNKSPLQYRKHSGGENFIDVKHRAKKFVDSINSIKKYKTVIIVSHNTFLLMLLSYVKGWSIKKSLEFKLNNMMILNIKKEGGGIRSTPDKVNSQKAQVIVR